MPQIRMKGMKIDDVKIISKILPEELAKILGCPKDHFTIEYIPITYFMEGVVVESYPFIEVAWFDRGQKVQDKVAKFITETIVGQGYDLVEVAFISLDRTSYYENGVHF